MERFEFKRAKENINSEFWIDTEGRCHKFKGSLRNADKVISFHYEIANSLYPKIEHPEDFLFNIGWIAVGGYDGNRIKNEPTQAQINTLNDLDYKRIRDSHGILYNW